MVVVVVVVPEPGPEPGPWRGGDGLTASATAANQAARGDRNVASGLLNWSINRWRKGVRAVARMGGWKWFFGCEGRSSSACRGLQRERKC